MLNIVILSYFLLLNNNLFDNYSSVEDLIAEPTVKKIWGYVEMSSTCKLESNIIFKNNIELIRTPYFSFIVNNNKKEDLSSIVDIIINNC
jgi:hypothetical protein